VRMDAQCMSRIMNIVIHYELGNYEVISSLIRSTNRFLLKVDRKFKFETSFLKFANKHFQNKYYPEQQGSFQNEIDNLTKITEDPFEKKAIEFFDVISWLKTKTENKPMEELISGKVAKERFHRGVI
jgi:hypothetical protein